MERNLSDTYCTRASPPRTMGAEWSDQFCRWILNYSKSSEWVAASGPRTASNNGRNNGPAGSGRRVMPSSGRECRAPGSGVGRIIHLGGGGGPQSLGPTRSGGSRRYLPWKYATAIKVQLNHNYWALACVTPILTRALTNGQPRAIACNHLAKLNTQIEYFMWRKTAREWNGACAIFEW